LSNAVTGLTFSPNIARFDANGRVICAALPVVGDFDATQQAWWKEVISRRDFMISAPTFGRSSNRRILLGILPLYASNGAFDGTLNIAIDINWLDALLRYKRLPHDAVVALFDKSGKLIVASNPEVAGLVFAKGASAEDGHEGTLQAEGPDHKMWSFAMAPLIRRDTYVGFAMPESDLFSQTYLHVATDLLLPALMILLASGAIWYAADRLVVRWIVLLQRVAVAYARGHYAVRPVALKQAPREFRDLGSTLSDMALAIQERDTSLRDAVNQKSYLIKEIHHRVKNNLQIVMSLLSLQSSKMPDSPAREALEQARTRINALALVHRILYEQDNGGMVEMQSLLTELAEQLHQGFGGERRGVNISVDVPERRLVIADLAIPLTLFTVEALTTAYKHAFAAATKSPTLTVRLIAGNAGRLKLVIVDTGGGGDLTNATNGFGTAARLMSAFAQQVGGQVTTSPAEGGVSTIELEFPDPAQQSKLPEEIIDAVAAS